jgi:hypothetical protein
MPAGAQTLSVGAEPGTHPCVYALVDVDAPFETRRFLVLPPWTPLIGHDVHAALCVGSFMWGGLRYHVFDQQHGSAL